VEVRWNKRRNIRKNIIVLPVFFDTVLSTVSPMTVKSVEP